VGAEKGDAEAVAQVGNNRQLNRVHPEDGALGRVELPTNGLGNVGQGLHPSRIKHLQAGFCCHSRAKSHHSAVICQRICQRSGPSKTDPHPTGGALTTANDRRLGCSRYWQDTICQVSKVAYYRALRLFCPKPNRSL